jgi:uncharacterized protein
MLGMTLVDRLLGLTPRVSRIQVERDLKVPMPDGVALLADWYRPAGAEPMPVVLIRCPYGRRGFWGAVFGAAFARQGLQVVLQSVRGTFGSGGEFLALRQEKEDGLATAAWLREQAWCDGRLAGAGLSYLGFTQWAAAPYADPPFSAVCLGITASEFNSNHYPGGSFGLLGALSWSVQTGLQERISTPRAALSLLGDPVRQRRTNAGLTSLPLREADTVAIGRTVGRQRRRGTRRRGQAAGNGPVSRFWRDVVAHAEPGDDFWATADHSAAVARLTAPATMMTGWYDIFLPWQLRDFRALRAAGRTARITIGPWAHSDPPGLNAQVHDQVAWLRAHLLGDELPDRLPVRGYLQHADTWLEFPQWPPARATPTPLYLHPDGGLDWQPPPEGAPDTFTYDPADPTPTVGGPLLRGKTRQRDNRAVEARPDVLVYTSAPLPADLDLMGEVRATIHVRARPEHADVFVRLCDVDTRGVSRNICDGILRLRPGTANGAAQQGEQPVAAEVEMWPTGYRLRRGHRIRLQVSGGGFPRFQRNHGTGEPVADAVAMVPCRQEVYRDPAHPSHVVLPVLT